MLQYSIANHLVQVSGTGLNHLSRFTPFISTETNGKEPILHVQMGVRLEDRNVAPLYSFPFGAIAICNLAVSEGTYLFKMERTGYRDLLMEIKNQNGRFFVTTNMDENVNVDLLRFGSWIAFNIAFAHHQTIALHASTVCYEGKSALFLGESGTGKSTHTQLWLDHIPNTELLNDDSPFVRIMDNHSVWVFGSPWSGKTPCYKNRHTPIAAIVRLSQSPYNKITRLKGIAAFGALLPSCPPAFAYDETLLGNITNILNVVLEQIPVYSLECLPNPEAAHLVFNTLKESGRL